MCALEDLTLQVERGEIFGLLGPNGAGKTTTIRLLAGLLEPTRGHARVQGLEVSRHATQVRRLIGVVPGEAGNHRHLTLIEELIYYGGLYDLPAEVVRARAGPLLERLGLTRWRDHRVGTYSKGMRRKAQLIRALLHEPSILLLDEPTSGLDPAVAEVVWQLLRELSETRGVTVVLCSHHLEEVERLCPRIGMLRTRLRALGTLDQVAGGRPSVRVRVVGACDPAVVVARELGLGEGLVLRADGIQVALSDPGAEIPRLIRALVGAGVAITAVEPRERDLRQAYRERLGEEPS